LIGQARQQFEGDLHGAVSSVTDDTAGLGRVQPFRQRGRLELERAGPRTSVRTIHSLRGYCSNAWTRPERADRDRTRCFGYSVPVAITLRKWVALGGGARAAGLRSWASRELNGYKVGDDDFPEWRIVGAVLQIDGKTARAIIKGQCPLRMRVAAPSHLKSTTPIPLDRFVDETRLSRFLQENPEGHNRRLSCIFALMRGWMPG